MSTLKDSECTSVNLDNSLKALEDTIDYYYNTFTMTYLDTTATDRVSGKGQITDITHLLKDQGFSSTPVSLKQSLPDGATAKIVTPKQKTLHELLKLPGSSDKASGSVSQQKKRKVISPIQPIHQDTSDDDESDDDATKVNTEHRNSDIIVQMQKSFNVAIKKVAKTLSKTFLTQFDTITEELTGIKSTLETRDEEIFNLSQELQDCQNKNKLNEGRITRAEKEIRDLKSELFDLKARSMKNNLVFYNIQESTEPEIPEKLVKNFLQDEMKISAEEVNNVKIENAHRMGQKGRGSRPIVVRFGQISDKDKVLRHAKNLDKSKHFRVDHQLPPELRAKKQQLLPRFHEAKRMNKSVRWTGQTDN